MSHRLGRPAQKEFALLCAHAQVTCNGSDEDDHGWDFIIEVTPKESVPQTADKGPGIRKALVQIKSTHGNATKSRIKVSNALKMAKDELPFFVALFHYDDAGGKRIYIRHFWTDLIERALMCGRKASANRIQTHKTYMEICFCEKDEHTHDLVAWLVAQVRDNSAEYSTKKRSICETLGYEDKNYRAEITFGPIDGIADVVDHELGLSDYLPVSKFRVVDSRFGIDVPVELGSDHGRIQIRRDGMKCNTVIQTDSGDVISFEGSMRTPGIPNLPTNEFKIAVETWCFIAIISAEGRLSVEIKELWAEKLPIENIGKMMKLLSWNGQEMSIKFVGDDFPSLSFEGRFIATPHESFFSKMSMIIGTLQNIQVRAGRVELNLSFTDLYACFTELSFVYDFLEAENVELCAEWDTALRNDVKISRILGYSLSK